MPGCTDTAPPERYTAYELSRIRDALNLAAEVNPNVKDVVWKALPFHLRMEYLYTKWEYVARR